MKNLREKWKQGIPTFGPFVGLNAPGICEIMGHAGFDYCVIDLEHGAIDLETAENMVRGANAADIAPIIRVAVNREELIGQALDLGAAGVHVPTISTATEAQKVVWAARFSPLGSREVDPAVRAARYSADRRVFFDNANKETLVTIAIEGVEEIKNLPEILQVKGIDVLFVEPYDLSQSLGMIGQVRHPKVSEKIREIVTVSKKSGVAVGVYTDTPEVAREWAKQGVLYCCLGVDAAILYNASSDLVRQARTDFMA